MKNPCSKDCILLVVCTTPCDKKRDYLLYLTDEINSYKYETKPKDSRYETIRMLRVQNRIEIMEIFSRKSGNKHEKSM